MFLTTKRFTALSLGTSAPEDSQNTRLTCVYRKEASSVSIHPSLSLSFRPPPLAPPRVGRARMRPHRDRPRRPRPPRRVSPSRRPNDATIYDSSHHRARASRLTSRRQRRRREDAPRPRWVKSPSGSSHPSREVEDRARAQAFERETYVTTGSGRLVATAGATFLRHLDSSRVEKRRTGRASIASSSRVADARVRTRMCGFFYSFVHLYYVFRFAIKTECACVENEMIGFKWVQ